jgi:Tfp pilus assembly protein PilF
MRKFKFASPLAITSIACVFCLMAIDNPLASDRLWEHRNLGKAFYENPDTHMQAVTELHAALLLNPKSVRERINYGLGLLRAGQTEAGIAELIRAQTQNPTLPHTWFNLGIAYKHAGDYKRAIEQFKGMIRLVPLEAVAHYNLATVLRAQGNVNVALPEFLKAERLNPKLAGPHFQLFGLYQRAGNQAAAASERQAFQEAKKRNDGAPVAEDMEWCLYAELYDPLDARPSAANAPTLYDGRVISRGWAPDAHLLAIDSEGVGHADLLVWSSNRVELLKHATESVKTSGLEKLKDIRSIAAGDFDNDGLTDLCVVTGSGAALYHNNRGVFARIADLPGTAGTTTALWLDFDHDYDLDLLLFGPQPVLMRSDGKGKFEDKTSAFPFAKGATLDAVTTAIRSDNAARDVVASYRDRPGVLYRDRLNGIFEASDLAVLPAGAASLDAQDFDHDGFIDLVSYQPKALFLRNDEGTFVKEKKPLNAAAPLRADFNGDNREDYASIAADGNLSIFFNASSAEHWMTTRIQGTKNIKTAPDAIVEMKSGAFYEKAIYRGVPLVFALDGHADADTIRITWPNGLIQNELHQKATSLNIREAQRLSGSCPMIFTWNGHNFQFITDVLGVAPLGASSGDGSYFPVDHDEYIQIPGSALQVKDGRYQIHITEELHEVSYLDQIQLVAVDHPSSLDIYTNDKFKSPPYPEFRLFGASEKLTPIRATDDSGTDVTARLARIDRVYPESFHHDTAGVADLHTLNLDFGKSAPDNRAALVLNGWVDWADGSTFLGASQSGQGLIFPYLQVKDRAGKWQTVVEDMGIPSGKPKTIVVDLAGKFLSASREVRIVTNLCVYWDQIFLIQDSRAPKTKLTRIGAQTASLNFRGFSQAVIDRSRQQPEKFLYDHVQPVSNWNPTPGLYTHYGDVLPLMRKADDRMVIIGSGDELSLEFPASSLPLVPEGWTRDFLLLVDGWAKDADANTAFSQSVLPLPFHAMSAYPYKRTEHFPDDAAHADYVREYLTRPALRLLRPLAPARVAE